MKPNIGHGESREVGMAKICKVLVVEDHDGIRAVLGQALKTEGYDFTLIASTGDVSGALDGDHDVVVIDVPLSEGDAFVLAEAARANGLGVILTSSDQRLFAGIESSGHCHIRKPFMLDDLLPLINGVLRDIDNRCVRRRRAARGEAAPRRARRR
jgi:DNA-binding response OmpR family regulator